MQTFKRLDQNTFLLSKPSWHEEDRLTSKCIGLEEMTEFSFKGDVRIIWPEALFKYLKYIFKDLFMVGNESYKEAILIQLREMYKSSMKEFKELILPKIDYKRPLFKHQTDAIQLMIKHKYNLLSLSQGLGKTITSATVSKVLGIKRTLIICPSAVKWNWLHDMCDEWGYDPMNWTILDAQKSKCQYAFIEKFVVVNYENVMKHAEYLIRTPIDHIIIDECQKIKNPSTMIYKAAKGIVDKFPEARVTLLSGTPVTNRIDDMFAYYKLFGHILGKNKSYFSQRYVKRVNGLRGKIIGAQNLDELTVRQSNFFIRKRAEECLNLPDLLINKYYMDEVEMSKEYEETLKEMYQNRLALSEATENKSIRQMEGSISGNVHTLNRILATAKVSKVIELIDTLWLEGRKVIVFSGYTAPLNLLEEHYKDKCVKIDGSVGSHKRSLLIEKYKSEKNCHVFLGNVKAAGVGINLVNSCDVIFMNFPFTPDDLEQPYKRAHRIGQHKTVNVYFTIVKDSIDQHIYSIITDKSKDINNLIDKNKKGVVHYESGVMNLVFNQLTDQYAKEHNLAPIKQNEFQKV